MFAARGVDFCMRLFVPGLGSNRFVRYHKSTNTLCFSYPVLEQISVVGCKLTASWGRIGKKRQNRELPFPDHDQALVEGKKRAQAKIRHNHYLMVSNTCATSPVV